ncbi:Lanosterol 14-alpha demethylase-like [Oopsacas minuta]|uniref:Lanosterol 14-alpha demethylase n=1 Tax=Oopsacas minuta TaxID=111878 RepID=A0AAV7JZJ9_9METZ|nr:Lanosterol 14-alpha demethylase-like [Oopsacas minuta]
MTTTLLTTNFSFILQSLLILFIITVLYFIKFRKRPISLPQGKRLPPVVPHSVPFLGHAVSFGKDPLNFLQSSRDKYGDVFTFRMIGMDFTYLLGSDACTLFFNSKNEDLNAEDVYQKITTPVFGEGVAYDVPNKVFGEQKRMMKTGLTIARFRNYVPYIEQEAELYTRNWSTNEAEIDIFMAMSELVINTASRCLHGKEIRSKLDEGVAQLYLDLDKGFSQLAWLLPAWLPLPSFRTRDKAHHKMKKMFRSVIANRRVNPDSDQEDDFLHVLINSQYKSGTNLSDEEIAGMLIAMLMAGQHTSSTTSAWLILFLSQDKTLQDRVYEELMAVCGDELSYDDVKNCDFLDRCVRETLRVRPPLMTLMRMCRVQQTVGEFCIPVGHQVCVSPSINQQGKDVWSAPVTGFDPDRYLDPNEGQVPVCERGCPAKFHTLDTESQEKFNYIPFGAGRHRCVGELFAYVQIKSLIAYLVRHFEFELIDGRFPEINYATMIHTPKDPIIRYRRRII